MKKLLSWTTQAVASPIAWQANRARYWEIDVRFLQQITESEYLYEKLVELPEPGRSVPAMFNPGLSENGTANRVSL